MASGSAVAALRRFAWSAGGYLSVAVTPTARRAPFARVKVAGASISMTSRSLTATFGLKAPRRWSFPGANVRAVFKPADDPLLSAAMTVPVATSTATAAGPRKPVARVRGKSLQASAALPAKPGAYRATLTLTDRRFGRVVARAGEVAVFVPGPRSATLSLHMNKDTIESGRAVPVSLSVANTGTQTWAEPNRVPGAQASRLPARATRVVARWIPLDGQAGAGAPATVELGAVPLAPGKLTVIKMKILAPDSPGTWALVVDVVDDVDGSFAALGSAPAVRVFELIVPPAIEELE